MFLQLANCVTKNATSFDRFCSLGRQQDQKLSSTILCRNHHWSYCRDLSTILTGNWTHCCHVTLTSRDIWQAMISVMCYNSFSSLSNYGNQWLSLFLSVFLYYCTLLVLFCYNTKVSVVCEIQITLLTYLLTYYILLMVFREWSSGKGMLLW